MTLIHQLFRAHPEAVDEGYFEHMGFALKFAWRLFRAGGAALVHAFVPALCETTASSAILGMNDELRARRAAMVRGKPVATAS